MALFKEYPEWVQQDISFRLADCLPYFTALIAEALQIVNPEFIGSPKVEKPILTREGLGRLYKEMERLDKL